MELQYSIIPDQIEAGTFMCAAAATRGDIMVKNVIPKHLEAISAKLIEIGCEVIEFDDAVRVVGKPSQRHTDIKTLHILDFLQICSLRWQLHWHWQVVPVW